MKLVQLLAKELKEWPNGVDVYAQDPTGSVFPWTGSPDHNGEQWIISGAADVHMGVSRVIGGYSACDDHMTANVTKSQWQAEREKMNKPKWIRHRGGKCPVKAGTKVSTRHRDGYICATHFYTQNASSDVGINLVWSHQGDKMDIMAYRAIEETKDQEIEEVKDTNIGTLTYKLEIDAIDANKEIDSLVAKWGQIESPLKWRDTIIHCQAIIEDCEREIERNVSLLDAEGLMMQKDSKKAMQHYQTAIDMSDWRNWQAGDIFEVVKKTDYFTVGNRYSVKYTANTDAPITATDDDGDEFCLLMEEIKFIRRP